MSVVMWMYYIAMYQYVSCFSSWITDCCNVSADVYITDSIIVLRYTAVL